MSTITRTLRRVVTRSFISILLILGGCDDEPSSQSMRASDRDPPGAGESVDDRGQPQSDFAYMDLGVPNDADVHTDFGQVGLDMHSMGGPACNTRIGCKAG